MDDFSDAEQQVAAPTTQSPIGCTDRGLRPSTEPRNADSNARFDTEVEWNVPITAKLDLDFSPVRWLRAVMDDDAELIIQLCTRIGVIMEDASPDALTIGSLSPEQRVEQLRRLGRAADQISAIAQAAISLSV